MKIDVYARKVQYDYLTLVNSYSCLTALEAVITEIALRYPETKKAYEISAADNYMSVYAVYIKYGVYDIVLEMKDGQIFSFEYKI